MGINVLSLFDGMSCGYQALKNIGVVVDNYFASEIDKYAIKVAMKNHPNIIQLGDVTNWESWNLPKIDLLLAGSPCQGFSMAGKMMNFNDPRSGLFFDFMDVLSYYEPKHFLLENVKMKKEWENLISCCVGVKPVEINSSDFSAQSRRRLYWSNIQIKETIGNKNVLSDILDINVNDQLFLSDKAKLYMEGYAFGGKRRYDYMPNKLNSKSSCLVASMNKGVPYGVIESLGRRLSPLECERLQTLPDNYTSGVSDSQRYKMLGNGWTVAVIEHILSGLPYRKRRVRKTHNV